MLGVVPLRRNLKCHNGVTEVHNAFCSVDLEGYIYIYEIAGIVYWEGFMLRERERLLGRKGIFLMGGERRLLLSWAKAGKDSKEGREATRSEG